MREQIEVGAGGDPRGVVAARPWPPSGEPHRRRRERGGAAGPRPVRPATLPAPARPGRVAPPHRVAGPARPGPRVLVRGPSPAPPVRTLRARVRAVAAGLGVAVLSATVVVGLGLLADAAGSDGGPAPSRSAVHQPAADAQPLDRPA
jgi:hypothetical protein